MSGRQNQLLKKFEDYKNKAYVPYQGNRLLSQDRNLRSDLDLVANEKAFLTSIKGKKNRDLIEEIFTPLQIPRGMNQEIISQKIRDRMKEAPPEFECSVYKPIQKDSEIDRVAVAKYQGKAFLKHKVDKAIDADRSELEKDFQKKLRELSEVDDYLKSEFSEGRYAENLAKFQYNEAYRAMASTEEDEEKDLRKERIEYYKKQQKELDRSKQLADKILAEIDLE